jgi:orotate phosphoribosyltransferase
MTSDDVLDEFRAAGALREGHFVLSSGLHSPVFLQKNLVFMDTARCARLCKALAEKIISFRLGLGSRRFGSGFLG